jgi:UDP-N-acetylmuramate--alanine ligase
MEDVRYHFSGIAGAGVNPLARLMRARGHHVQGSDRSFDQGKSRDVADELRALGIDVRPQDGRALTAELDRFVFSVAVEADTPEMRRARELQLELVARPALLAEIINAGHPSVAVAGTSGKSTITGMVAWLVRESGMAATVLGGAALAGERGIGCLVAGPEGGPVIAEACESDGTLVGYLPAVGLIHNISRDHGEVETLRAQFTAFAKNCAKLLVNAACPEAIGIGRALDGVSYGIAPDAGARLDVATAGPHRARGTLHAPAGSLALDVPQPGVHNLENAAAAALIALELGMRPPAIEAALARFPGVARRFQVVGTTASGIRVIDDYAHNGEKIRAAVTTAQAGARRVLAIFQPHGFGPARFLRPELRALIPRLLRHDDRFCYAEIFYGGGTVARDISSRMLADDLPRELGVACAENHDAVVRWVVNEARAGDTVLLMGARDPDLPRLAQQIFRALESRPVTS